jgi:hypothetical protein
MLPPAPACGPQLIRCYGLCPAADLRYSAFECAFDQPQKRQAVKKILASASEKHVY